jgi:hypothetical protein
MTCHLISCWTLADDDDALRRGAWLVPAEACFVFTEQVGGLRCVPRLALWRRFGKN